MVWLFDSHELHSSYTTVLSDHSLGFADRILRVVSRVRHENAEEREEHGYDGEETLSTVYRRCRVSDVVLGVECSELQHPRFIYFRPFALSCG
jgi:hypothetical protein